MKQTHKGVAYNRGYYAGKTGKPISYNPYAWGTNAHLLWIEGWEAAIKAAEGKD